MSSGNVQEVAKALSRLARLALGIGAVGTLAQSVLYVVEGGHRAVIFNRFKGVEETVSDEGMHFRVPWLQRPVIFSVRTRAREIPSVTGTKDLQMVNLVLRVLSRPDKDHLPEIYSRLGLDYDERVLPSIANEVLKATVAQYNAEQLLTQREQVSQQIRQTLTERAKTFNIILDDVSMTHLTFGREFAQAIEAKQVAQQDAERSKYIVMVAEQERNAAVTRAEGESEAAKLISDALAEVGDGLVQLRRIEAAKDISKIMAMSRNVTYLPQNGNVLLNMGA